MSHGTPVRVMVMGCAADAGIFTGDASDFVSVSHGTSKTWVINYHGITVCVTKQFPSIKSLKWIFPLTHAIFGEHFDKLCTAVGSVMVFKDCILQY